MLVVVLENSKGESLFAELQLMFGQPGPRIDLNHFFYEVQRSTNFLELTRAMRSRLPDTNPA